MPDTLHNDVPAGAGVYTVGELVDVTIRGARVVSTYLTSTVLDLNDDGGVCEIAHRPGITFARVAPPEWPPQPGDVWSDCDGATWVALGDLNGAVEMHMSKDITSRWSDPYEVLSVVSPMRLEYRHGWTRPDPAPAADPAEVDKRVAIVVGLRAMATFLEKNPNLPMPYGFGGQLNTETRDELRALVDEYGAEVAYDNEDKLAAKLWQGPVYLTFYCTEPRPAPVVDEPTQLLPVVPLPGVGAQPVDDPVEEGDDRCRSTHRGEFAPGQHYCELYGPHPAVKHICICGTEWENANAGSYDPVTGLTGGGAIFDDVPAQRDAVE